MANVILKDFYWKRMIAAVEDVRERACRATGALRGAGIPHVVVGGNAVAAWVARVSQEAVRNTKGADTVPTLEALVRMKLTSFHLQDQVHLLDLLEVGLIDGTWCDRLPDELTSRLLQLIDTRDREA